MDIKLSLHLKVLCCQYGALPGFRRSISFYDYCLHILPIFRYIFFLSKLILFLRKGYTFLKSKVRETCHQAGVCHSAGKFYLHDDEFCVSDICIDDRLRKTEFDLDLFSALRLNTY